MAWRLVFSFSNIPFVRNEWESTDFSDVMQKEVAVIEVTESEEGKEPQQYHAPGVGCL